MVSKYRSTSTAKIWTRLYVCAAGCFYFGRNGHSSIKRWTVRPVSEYCYDSITPKKQNGRAKSGLFDGKTAVSNHGKGVEGPKLGISIQMVTVTH